MSRSLGLPAAVAARVARLAAVAARVALSAAAVLVVLSACTAAVEPDEPEIPSPFTDCAALTGSAPAATELPEVVLPCFTGGAEVSMGDLRLPAVINIWASFCAPCRDELPVMQGLADRADGRYTVVGVDSGDGRSAAASFAADHDVSFPTLFDPERRFASALGQATLPVTVFVGADGRMYVHREAVNVDDLIKLMPEHTGVTVKR
ncbi:TlpA family protein disulfide reductase [Actinoplanes sp. GCM10030250]|uniref:TlpA family protein disulfide reductase n=1 Tax=Actinoplanes sp. GCM10030250 TaxID=3273376 RepID=UPI003619D364